MTIFEPYRDMVVRLFKKLDNRQVELHHATTGLCGEAAELLAAIDRANILEELGDLRFYFVACRSKLYPTADQINQTREVLTSPCYLPSNSTVMNNIIIICGELLDYTKRSWIYSEHPSKGVIREYEIHQALALLDINLSFYVELMGFTWEQVEFGNQMKLIGTADQKGRYHSGEYSDAQAIERADKS